ncbi:MAG: lysine exporter LysO family protein [Rikenellaceae bacterium]
MKGSLIMVSFFVVGVLLQKFVGLPAFFHGMGVSYTVMLVLMLVVGIGIGIDEKALKALKGKSFKMMLVPIGTVVATLLTSIIITPFLGGMTIFDTMAVGSGFGYYSLSTVIITNAKGAELGTIALVANILREVLTILLAPLFVKVFGKLAPIASGASTTMDITLPSIVKFSGKEYAVLAIFNGIVLSFVVPILVSFFVSF